MSGEWKKTTCAFCSVCCGLEMKVADNHFVDVRPDPDNRRSRNYCCRKADVNNNYSNILHKDHKLRLFTPEMDEYIGKITPDKEKEALYGNSEYPFVMSAGIHRDGGHNGWMRNHATHIYRNPCTMEINPQDAGELGLIDGGKAKLITKTTEAEVDVEYSFRTSRGYVTVPHHHGFTVDGKTYGIGVNKLTGSDEMDPVTGDPVWRYIPCRIEKAD